MPDEFLDAYKADMWRVDVEGYPVSVKGQVARAHLEQVNRRLAMMKLALHQIAQLAQKPGGVGQVARDALRAVREIG